MSLCLRLQGGFCNRLRAIVAGVLWAEDLNRKLVLYSPVEPGHMPCRIDELIVSSSIPHLCCLHAGYLTKAHAVQSVEEMNAVLQLGTGGPGVDEIRIESYAAFHPETYKARGLAVLRALRFDPELETMADSYWSKANGKSSWIAVHIRQTDHVKCIKASPLECFLEVMNIELGQNPDQTFLLCCDDNRVVEDFQATFGKDKIVSPVVVKGRKLPEQQMLGLVDWLLLQKCSRIIGSAGSSFSELAALRSLGEMPEQVRPITRES